MGVLNFRIGNYEKLASSSVRMFRLAACRQFQVICSKSKQNVHLTVRDCFVLFASDLQSVGIN